MCISIDMCIYIYMYICIYLCILEELAAFGSGPAVTGRSSYHIMLCYVMLYYVIIY